MQASKKADVKMWRPASLVGYNNLFGGLFLVTGFESLIVTYIEFSKRKDLDSYFQIHFIQCGAFASVSISVRPSCLDSSGIRSSIPRLQVSFLGE